MTFSKHARIQWLKATNFSLLVIFYPFFQLIFRIVQSVIKAIHFSLVEPSPNRNTCNPCHTHTHTHTINMILVLLLKLNEHCNSIPFATMNWESSCCALIRFAEKRERIVLATVLYLPHCRRWEHFYEVFTGRWPLHETRAFYLFFCDWLSAVDSSDWIFRLIGRRTNVFWQNVIRLTFSITSWKMNTLLHFSGLQSTNGLLFWAKYFHPNRPKNIQSKTYIFCMIFLLLRKKIRFSTHLFEKFALVVNESKG